MLRERKICAEVIQFCVLREGRNGALGDTVFCAERGENLSGGRYGVVC